MNLETLYDREAATVRYLIDLYDERGSDLDIYYAEKYLESVRADIRALKSVTLFDEMTVADQNKAMAALQ